MHHARPGARAVVSSVKESAGSRTPIESARWQCAAVIAATVAVAALHWSNDGLWFQGDAPRHAANGLFLFDYLRSLPAEPVSFALSYYARYPIITPLVYPPLFYLFEALAFALLGPSPLVAKSLVLASGSILGLYTMAWARRWGGAAAGWAGACVVLLPGFVHYSNAVLLNVPATALGIGALYHLMAWLDRDAAADRRWFVILTIAALATYYPAALVLPVAVLAMGIFGRWPRSRVIWLITAAVLAIVVVAAAVLPQHWARHAPSGWRLFDTRLWVFYAEKVVGLSGAFWTVLGAIGVALLIAGRWRRRELTWLIAAFPVAIGCLVLLPAESERYALLLLPLVVIAAWTGLSTALNGRARLPGWLQAGLVLLLVGITGAAAVRVPVPAVSGFEAAVAYLRAHGPADTVLYSGNHDGVFTYYVRTGDPDFDRRVVLAHRLLARYEQTREFWWQETPYVHTPEEVVSLIQRQCGCRWIAVEIGLNPVTESERLLRLALYGPEFEHAASFPIAAPTAVRLEVYRFGGHLDPPPPVDLVFPSFNSRVFQGIQPVAPRR
jgi:hypothetical protein